MLDFLFILIGGLFLLGALDDLFIDGVHLFFRVRPRSTSPNDWIRWRALPEQRLAIMIPAWQEASVLEAMVRTNLSRIRYSEYKWFIGVYPNDPATLSIAKDLESRHPGKVEVVVTDRPGPTSKAHCLNCILTHLEISRNQPDLIAIHDAEDVIHPDAFTAVNRLGRGCDFIQVPIFSLPVPASDWVSGTYLDEFSEIHLKEIPVRKILGMPIPSAGVGTFFSASILEEMRCLYGYSFDERNLTEDYEISLRIRTPNHREMGGIRNFPSLPAEKPSSCLRALSRSKVPLVEPHGACGMVVGAGCIPASTVARKCHPSL